ncbi:hypothetical protein FB451DRAFT_1408008 [Mycena latifolia]|nr:hypothetical protein FB451DRAFT_1408008 [Mycena latifolia]
MLMMDSSNPSTFTNEPEEMPMPVTLPEPVIAKGPKLAQDVPAPEEPQPQRAVDHPAQEPAPAVDEAVYFNLVPATPMHMIVAEASPGRASETVIGVEKHAAAVSPYPYGLQPAQDAPAKPVAEANVPESAEVPQPRQWVDEGKGISSIPMPMRSPHGSSATLRAALMLYCGFTARLRLVTLGRVALLLHQGLIRRVVHVSGSVCLGTAKALVCAGSEGGESGVQGSEALYLHGSEPSEGGMRARGSAKCAVSNVGIAVGIIRGPTSSNSRQPALRLRYRRKRGRARTALDGEDSRDVLVLYASK